MADIAVSFHYQNSAKDAAASISESISHDGHEFACSKNPTCSPLVLNIHTLAECESNMIPSNIGSSEYNLKYS